jgi:hypothetical protein
LTFTIEGREVVIAACARAESPVNRPLFGFTEDEAGRRARTRPSRARPRRPLHAATIALVGEVPIDRLRHAVPAFPTRSEVWLRLLEQAGA